MLSLIARNKGVIVFYLLLAFGFFFMSYKNQMEEKRNITELSIVTNN